MKRYGKELNNNTIREFKNLLMKGHPNKKELQTSSFRIPQYFGFRGLTNEIEAAGTAAQAKNFAREIHHSEKWDRIRISLMRELLCLKWEQVPIYREELNACRSKESLHPVPVTFWGTGVAGKKGRNKFGVFLDHLLKYHVRNSLI